MKPLLPWLTQARPDLDDAGRVRIMGWTALAAGPLAFLGSGVGLVLSHATLHSRGGDVSRATPGGYGTFATILMVLTFLGVVEEGRTSVTFRRIGARLLLGMLGAVAGNFALAWLAPRALNSAQASLLAALASFPLVLAGGYGLFRRNARTEHPSA